MCPSVQKCGTGVGVWGGRYQLLWQLVSEIILSFAVFYNESKMLLNNSRNRLLCVLLWGTLFICKGKKMSNAHSVIFLILFRCVLLSDSCLPRDKQDHVLGLLVPHKDKGKERKGKPQIHLTMQSQHLLQHSFTSFTILEAILKYLPPKPWNSAFF